MPTKTELARIHLAKKAMGLDDDEYRCMLRDRYGVQSAKDLNPEDVRDLLAHCAKVGALSSGKGWQGRPQPSEDRKPMINKIIKLSDLLGRLGEGKTFLRYADGIAKAMFFRGEKSVEIFVEHLTSGQLHKVVTALIVQCKREKVQGFIE